jgi:L-seryl-tRNA(Ser) seleniumtransferase
LLLGKRELIDQLKRHPLARALRADKLCLAALTATLTHYRRGEALTHIPVWQMIARPLESVRGQAEAWRAQVGGQVIEGVSAVGGGSLPGETLPTALLALEVPSPDAALARLRVADPPVIARISEGHLLFDPRTVLPGQEQALLRAIAAL